ncbi:MAG: ABC transporter permease [Candidatus Thermoplasmatota archaeon]|jgi:peptide/nickel transport system permease protein|nr:ABC transporter permease [Candidatus Thermoplasmatota archaeon]MCL5874061.1 ABC transporter permease [Candidatus Thermoplasmatota archaeon]
MNPYVIARKVIQTVVLAILIAVILYVVFRLMPGNPAELILFGAKTHGASSQKLLQIETQLGLAGGKWNPVNFYIYMKDMFTFNFGYDYFEGIPVWNIIEGALPYTFLLFGTAAVLSFAIGIPLGVLTSWVRQTKKEAGLLGTANVLNAIPFFVLAIWLVIYFTALRPIFPISELQMKLYWLWTDPLKLAYYLFLPVTSLIVIEGAAHLLTTRAAMVGVLGEDYITTARAKGVSEGNVMFHHSARNAMIPVSTRMALEFALLMSGAVIVEDIFSYPGIGHLLYQATLTLDYTLSEGALFLISLVTILTYMSVDFIHAWLDPRIRL